ncbi:MAG: helix-turn-helix transcriptional regulator [Thermodesulfobacteriota bacterium]
MGLLQTRPRKEKERLRAFGLRVQQLRKMNHLSQEGLAHKVGYSRAHMGFIEQGKVSVPLVKIFKIADALNVDTQDLFRF